MFIHYSQPMGLLRFAAVAAPAAMLVTTERCDSLHFVYILCLYCLALRSNDIELRRKR